MPKIEASTKSRKEKGSALGPAPITINLPHSIPNITAVYLLPYCLDRPSRLSSLFAAPAQRMVGGRFARIPASRPRPSQQHLHQQRPDRRLSLQRLSLQRLSLQRLIQQRLSLQRLSLQRLIQQRLSLQRLIPQHLIPQRLSLQRLSLQRLIL